MTKDQMRLGHILDSILEIETYCAVGKEVFLAERMRQNATFKELENIGEAVKNLSEEFRTRYPDIPWKEIAGMRDILTHQYFGIDLELTWATVQHDLAPLRKVAELELKNSD